MRGIGAPSPSRRPVCDGSVATIGGSLNSLHLVVLGALFVGAADADEIGALLGLDVDDVAVLLAELERAGAIVTDDER